MGGGESFGVTAIAVIGLNLVSTSIQLRPPSSRPFD